MFGTAIGSALDARLSDSGSRGPLCRPVEGTRMASYRTSEPATAVGQRSVEDTSSLAPGANPVLRECWA